MIDNVENAIIQTMLTNGDYFTKVFPHLNKTHFQQIENIELYDKVKAYYDEYQVKPTAKEIGLSLKNIKQDNLKASVIGHFKFLMTSDKIYNIQFMVDETEKYVQKMEFTKAILEGADAVQNDKDLTPIYGMLGDALKINFDDDLGLVFNNDLERRLTYYKRKIQGMNTGVKALDKMLGGGFMKKTLNIIASVSHGGKSSVLAHFAAHRTLQGDCGLYYTLEMSEEETTRRIDANILDIDMNLFKTTPDEEFERKFDGVKNSLGTLVIKEYPAGTLDVLKIESHMNEFYMKYNKKPDYICVDYLTLMKSTRANLTGHNTYSYYKLISEELHGFAKKYDLPLITCSQINRSGYGNRDAGMENVSDSIGIAQTADTFCILVRTKELDEENKAVFNFVKNRNTGILSSCLVGINFPKMRFYDLDEFPEDSIGNGSVESGSFANTSKFDFGEDVDGMFD